jgi:hypothetical protein
MIDGDFTGKTASIFRKCAFRENSSFLELLQISGNLLSEKPFFKDHIHYHWNTSKVERGCFQEIAILSGDVYWK